MEIDELRNALRMAIKTDQMQLALGSLAGAGGTDAQMNSEAEAAVGTMVSRAGKDTTATSIPYPGIVWM
jgi:hypothetical protein